MAIKVAMIGAGSVGFTRGLMKDILTVPEDEISTAQVMYTIVGGKIRYKR